MSTSLCECEELKDENPIEEIHRSFLSETRISDKIVTLKKSSSEPNFHYAVDYNDLCGSWSFKKNPAFQEYDEISLKMCTWEFLSKDEMKFVKQHQQDRDAIFSLIGKNNCRLQKYLQF